ncbi:hypothetical protein BFN01_08220 [Microbacterium sp. AR7-10]|nr:hypothetical protein BFN01_08220 [Microbacterium sp. AR7-10]
MCLRKNFGIAMPIEHVANETAFINLDSHPMTVVVASTDLNCPGRNDALPEHLLQRFEVLLV